ncbi:hypothetical protein OGR47_08335 [Methylocystis sp. MJC1]|jgi:hypothetical protein|uniref:hypothetical protein n=1 Tax=Methylocystis sp. MJC1 TaxID=2654282 RepID=UPI0013EBDB9A|nr:hypothetical protein [Methylocystis sp. MJC1]KAF2991770.1 hypothetical protein MJC1_01335 [Methylocystis sp. MJC1]MBU6526992.1 hypothetical protein [Methylocystis sp. MJC1]UZX13430.1 hypothetical protein OGR47_08335 [Methylocystis sp. MJC1]
MKRNFSGWGVTAAGLLLAGGGAYGMSVGWDMIVVERGWSLFIAGSVALSGGVVTMALGRVVAHLARLGAGWEAVADPAAPLPDEEAAPLESVRTETRASPDPSPAKPETPRLDAVQAEATGPDFSSLFKPSLEEPLEVDRYTAGDATYVMMSDGSVEVRGPAGAQRYPSLAALRAEAESRQR